MRFALIAGLCACSCLALPAATPPKRRAAATPVKKKFAPPTPPAPRVLNEGEGATPNGGKPLTDAPIQASAVRWVTEEQVRNLVAGSTVAQVVEKLGQPFSRLVGDTQRFTYVMKNGSSAKLDFEDGKLTASRILPPER
ncbi:MAG: hypothetical protein IT162_17980 [Bryobacterales bacterium]|nr:hypothetical protein [Bryobacterales bacterium]